MVLRFGAFVSFSTFRLVSPDGAAQVIGNQVTPKHAVTDSTHGYLATTY